MYNLKKVFSDCLPVIPIRGVIFLPGADVRVEVGREFSKMQSLNLKAIEMDMLY